MTLFGQAEIIGGIIPNTIVLAMFCILIFYFAKTGMMSVVIGRNKKNLEKNL